MNLSFRGLHTFTSIFAGEFSLLKKILSKTIDLIAPEYTVHDQVSNFSPYNKRIPNFLIFTFEEPRVVLSHYKALKRLQDKNKDFNFLYFDKNRRDLYMQEYWSKRKIFHVYQNARLGQLRADIFRYCYIFDNGGFYLDFNKLGDFSFSNILQANTDHFFVRESTKANFISPQRFRPLFSNIISNSIFGATKCSPILGNVIASIEKNYEFYRGEVFNDPKWTCLQFSGPHMFTHQILEFLINDSFDKISFQLEPADLNGMLRFGFRGSKKEMISGGYYGHLKDFVIVE